MIEDLKTVFVFISMNLTNYIVDALKKVFLFFIGLTIIIVAFFTGLKLKIPFIYVISFSLLLLVGIYCIKASVFIKSQFLLNHNFADFLLNRRKQETKTGDFSKKEFMEVREKLRKSGKITPLKRTVLASHVASKIADKPVLSDSANNAKSLKKSIFRIHLAGYGLFLAVLVFFELISVILALVNHIHTDFIIFLSLIGFVFSYTLFSITIDPIICLLIQKRILEAKN